MRRIIYLSSSRTLLDDAEVAAILQISRTNNQRSGVSGLLVYHDGSFFQVLEGAAAAVQAVLDRIREDRRHTGILVLSDSDVDARAFPDWSMAYVTKQDLAGVLQEAAIPLKSLAANPERTIHDRKVNILLGRFLNSFRDLAQ